MIVACLCAEWCSVCRDYRKTFDEFARDFNGGRATWIDIEDQADLMGDVELDDFPALLVVENEVVRYFGTIAARAGSVEEILYRLREDRSRAVDDARLRGLAKRLGPPAIQ